MTQTPKTEFGAFPDLLSVSDLRSALGIGRTKAYELIRTGAFRSIRIGKTIRIPKREVIDYIDALCYNINQ